MSKNVVGLQDNNVLGTEYIYDLNIGMSQKNVNDSIFNFKFLKIINVYADKSTATTITFTSNQNYNNMNILVFTRYGISAINLNGDSNTINFTSLTINDLIGNHEYTASYSGNVLTIVAPAWSDFSAIVHAHSSTSYTVS